MNYRCSWLCKSIFKCFPGSGCVQFVCEMNADTVGALEEKSPQGLLILQRILLLGSKDLRLHSIRCSGSCILWLGALKRSRGLETWNRPSSLQPTWSSCCRWGWGCWQEGSSTLLVLMRFLWRNKTPGQYLSSKSEERLPKDENERSWLSSTMQKASKASGELWQLARGRIASWSLLPAPKALSGAHNLLSSIPESDQRYKRTVC